MPQDKHLSLPEITIDQLENICDLYGLSDVQAVILAVDRLSRNLNPRDRTQEARNAQLEAYMLANDGDESGSVEQVIPDDV